MIVTTYENNRCPVADCPHRFKQYERLADRASAIYVSFWHWHTPPVVYAASIVTLEDEVRVYESGLVRIVGRDGQLAEIRRQAAAKGSR